MSSEFFILMGTAAAIGFIHTVVGPDHYLPFIVLSKARQWSGLKTAVVTLLCGMGHIISSVVLGLIGIAIGAAVFKLESIESFRGDIASWFLIIFGFTYCIWGIHKAVRNQPHEHFHTHGVNDIPVHSHGHSGDSEHSHKPKTSNLTPWALFIIFVFGPCEPLIPLIMYPAAKGSIIELFMVTLVFGLVTLATMLAAVLFSYYGLSAIRVSKIERYSHAIAGFVIFLCGGAIKFLGL